MELFNLYFLSNTCADEEEECDELAVAEEDSSEVRYSSAASFMDEHSSQPSVPQGLPLYTPDFAQEPLLSNDASSLKFSEQLTEETPQPHTPGGSGPVEEGEQLTEETPQLNKAVEERGPQGGIWRGSEHGTHNTASICEHSGIVVLSGYTLHVWSALSNLNVRQSVWFVVPKCLPRGPCTPNALVSSLNFISPLNYCSMRSFQASTLV